MTRWMLVIALSVSLVAPVALAAGPPPGDDVPLPRAGGPSSVSRVDPLYSRIATTLAKNAVEVRCWSSDDWERLRGEWRDYYGHDLFAQGYYLNGRVSLSPETCRRLDAFAYLRKLRPGLPLTQTASAIATLAHESQHAAGIPDEPTAECYGVQHVRDVARSLRATVKQARALALSAWFDRYLRNPASYKSSECRNGGALDVRPISNVWP